MRIGFIIPYFYPAFEYGGTPRVAYEFARCLVRRGHEVTVVTTDSGGPKRIGKDTIATIQDNGLEGIRIFYYPNLSNYLAYEQRESSFGLPRRCAYSRISLPAERCGTFRVAAAAHTVCALATRWPAAIRKSEGQIVV